MSIVNILSRVFEELSKCFDCPCIENVRELIEALLGEFKKLINDLVQLEEALIRITDILYHHFIQYSDGNMRVVDLGKLVSGKDGDELRMLSRLIGRMLIAGYELRKINGRLYLVKPEEGDGS